MQTETEQNTEWSEVVQTWLFRGRVLFRRYWYVYLIAISLGIGLQAYREANRQPTYVSYAQMDVRGRIALPEGAVYSEEISNFFGTQMSLMQSGRVQQRAKDRVRALRPDLAATPVEISVAQSPNASIFLLSARGTQAEYTQVYLDAVMHEYLNLKRERRSQTAESTFISIMEKVQDYQEEIERLEQAKVDFQKENNIVFIQEQGSSAGSYLAKLNNQMADLRTQQRLLESVDFSQYIEGSGADQVDRIIFGEGAGATNDEYLSAKREAERLRAEQAEFSIYMKPAHPRIVRLKQDLERQENFLKIFRGQMYQQIQERRRTLQIEAANLTRIIDEWKGKALEYSRLLAEFDRMNSQLDRLKRMHDQLLASTQSLDLNRNMDQESVSILEPASVAQSQRTNVAKEIAVGAMVGFVLGTGLLFVLATIDSRFLSIEDVTQRFPVPILGVLPMQKRRQGQVELLKSNDQRLMFAESCRNIRSSLLYMDRQGLRPRTLVITSSVPAEGKSTLAGNLAIALGFAASKTILVDVDLRRGHLHKNFNLPNEKGVSELVRENLPLDSVIQRTPYENLDFIPCGKYPDRPGELLMSERFLSICDELKGRYDFVLFDSPPILATDDTPSFATKVDAAIFVIRASHTRVRQARSALENLRLRGVNLYGIVLNFTDMREPGHYSYKYYDYYSYRAPT